jgi:SecD/SecF fusion protein
MDKNSLWKWLVTVVLVIGSIVLVNPPVDQKDEQGKIVRRGKIRFGLDLKGGSSFTVKIDEEQVREQLRAEGKLTPEEIEKKVATTMSGAQSRALEVLRNRVDNLGISEPILYPGSDNRIIIQLPGIDDEKRKEAEASIKSLAFLEFRMVHEKNAELVADLMGKDDTPPGFIPHTAGTRNGYRPDPSFPASSKGPAYKAELGRFHSPPGYELLMQKDSVDGETVYVPYFVKRRRELSGDRLRNASVDYQALGQPVVQLQFDSEGATTFAAVTGDYAPGGRKNPSPDSFRQLAIVLDGTLYSAPVIREAIPSGRAEISGSFTLAEATFLSNILRAGSLPAPVAIVETRFVAPSLGSDSIRSGVFAAILGGIGVLLFMAVYYFVCGAVADIALILNLVLMPLGMIVTAGFLGIFAKDAPAGAVQLPVLTLPGIAGIILSLGMAVDANVLIFERMREESKSGKGLWSAVLAGYDRAFLAILDSNLTTIMTGIILFIFGSGPVRGFAVTLCAGIIVSMFTALTVTKLIFGLFAQKSRMQRFRMLEWVKDAGFNFLKHWKLAGSISLVVIAASWATMVYRGMQSPARVLGVDFTGGASVTFTFQPSGRVHVEDIRKALEGAGLKDVFVQYQREVEQGSDKYLHIKTSGDMIGAEKPISVIKSTMATAFPGSQFEVASEDEVGPQVGRELKQRAVWSMILALAGMIIYISWRFEMGFAMGAIVALIHDVLITAGVFVLFGKQMSLTTVAALLTIVGYSVNDTIVLFDRIREDLKLDHSKAFPDLCNMAINQTLSRTILTTLVTMITVVMLLVFGGGSIFDFALALFIGMIAGTYSTVFIATPVVLMWYRNRTPGFAAR